MVDGEQVPLHKQFNQMQKHAGAGMAMLITDIASYDTMPDGMKVTTANKAITYAKAASDGNMFISTANMVSAGAKTATCYIVVNNGPTYVASLELPQPEPVAPVEPEAPAEPETPAEPELVPPVADAPAEAPEVPAAAGAGTPAGLIVGVIAVVVIAAVAVVLLKKGKKN